MTVILPCSNTGWSKPHPHGPLLLKHWSLMLWNVRTLLGKSVHNTMLCQGILQEKVQNKSLVLLVSVCMCVLSYSQCKQFSTGDFTLKEVRRVTWEVRSEWKSLGIELGINPDTLQVLINNYNILLNSTNQVIHDSLQAIRKTNKGDVDECHTDMLIHWFRHPPLNTTLSWPTMVKALRSNTVNRGDIAHTSH